jgi:hypothetical protein
MKSLKWLTKSETFILAEFSFGAVCRSIVQDILLTKQYHGYIVLLKDEIAHPAQISAEFACISHFGPSFFLSSFVTIHLSAELQ